MYILLPDFDFLCKIVLDMALICFYSNSIYSYKKASNPLKNELGKNKIPISKYFTSEKEVDSTG